MFRSPLLFLFLSLSFFSCKKESEEKLQSKNYTQYAYTLLLKGDEHFNHKKFDSAFIYYNKAKSLLELEKDTIYLTYCLSQIAIVQQSYGDYNGSEETLTELINYKVPQYSAPANNQMGIISKEQKNYEDAIKYYSSVLKSTENKVDKQSALNNIAGVYIQKKEYSKAAYILETILKTGLLDPDTFQIKKAKVMDNLGYTYFKQNRIQEGLDYLNKGLIIRNKLEDTYDVIESYLHLADFYQNQDLQKSNEYALRAYKNATEHKSIDERLEALSFLMSNTITPGKNKYAIQFIALNDSITKVRNNAKNQFAKIKYDSKKEREENQKLKLENAENQLQYEKVKTQRLFFFIVLCAVLGSIVFIIKYFRNRNKKEKEKAVYDTETLISKQLHDELANDVFQVMSFTQTQDLKNPEKKEIILGNLDKIYSKTRDFSRKNSEIDTGNHFQSTLKQMLLDFADNKIKVIIKDNDDINWDNVQTQSKIVAYRVLQELMVNMKKHSSCSIVVIGLENKDNAIQFTYTDNGVGMSNSQSMKNGLHNVENRIKAIKGTITFEEETEKGFKAHFSLPK